MGTVNFRQPVISSTDAIASGLEDWADITARRAEARDHVVDGATARIRAAKRWCGAMDIAYWPAFAFGDKSPCRTAMAAAEAVLMCRHGRYGDLREDGTRSTGGFDSYGCHGLSGRDVQTLWFLAGCKDTPKFRWSVRSWSRDGYLHKKGDSLPFCRNLLRGYRWFTTNQKGIAARVGLEKHQTAWPCRKAMAVLGRLSPILRWAAVEGIKSSEMMAGKPLRIRDLNWDAVKRTQALLATGGERVRLALMPPRMAIHHVTGVVVQPSQVRDREVVVVYRLTPQYCGESWLGALCTNVALHDARRLVLGQATPKDIVAGGQFTDKLAHEFLLVQQTTAWEDPIRWYADRIAVPVHRSVRVMDWLAYLRKKGWWGELEKERVQVVAGQEHRFTAMGLLDEIQEEDIVTGREGVAAVLRRASERNGAEFFEKSKEDFKTLRHNLPTWVKKLPKAMRVLNTASALAFEGRDLKHCVGGYVNAVRDGRCIIVAVVSRHGRSTIEISDDLMVLQHRGVSNGCPPTRHDQLLRAFCNRHR
jgi:hypothetical protein